MCCTCIITSSWAVRYIDMNRYVEKLSIGCTPLTFHISRSRVYYGSFLWNDKYLKWAKSATRGTLRSLWMILFVTK